VLSLLGFVEGFEDVFRAIDRDGSGAVDHEEFRAAMRRLGLGLGLGLGLSKTQISDLMVEIDAGGNGPPDTRSGAVGRGVVQPLFLRGGTLLGRRRD
jgi:hypothetical protein